MICTSFDKNYHKDIFGFFLVRNDHLNTDRKWRMKKFSQYSILYDCIKGEAEEFV